MSRIGPVRLEVGCRDGLSREFESLDDLLAFDNSPAREISSLQIRAVSEDHETAATLKLNKDERSTIYVDLEGDEEDVSRLNQELESRLAGMEPWFSILTRADPLLICFAFLIAAMMSFLLAAASGLLPQMDDQGTALWVVVLVMFSLMIVLLPAPYLLGKILRGIFPAGTFAIEQGLSRHRTLEQVRWTVVVGFAVSLLAGVFVAAAI